MLQLQTSQMADHSDQQTFLKQSIPEEERKQEIQESTSNREKDTNFQQAWRNSITCPICRQIMVLSTFTNCGHAYCFICLDEYSLFCGECVICQEDIRHQRNLESIAMDTLILKYLKTYEPASEKHYTEQVNKAKQKLLKRKIRNCVAGTPVDIRDENYIWHQGKILRVYTKRHHKKGRHLVVKYSNSRRMDDIREDADSIAELGYFTGRTDVPHYKNGRIIVKDNDNKVTVLPKDEEPEVEV